MKKTILLPASLMLFSVAALAQNNVGQAPDQKSTTKIESHGPVTKTIVNESDARMSRYRAMTKTDLQAYLDRYETKLAANADRPEADKVELKKLIGEVQTVLAEKK